MVLAAVVICYYPDTDFVENVSSYSNGVDFLFIWDNTPGGSGIVSDYPNCIVLHNKHQNMGLPYAFNRVIEICRKKEVTHLMTMDQDSRWDGFESFRKRIEFLEQDGDNRFLYCPPLNTAGGVQEDKEIHDAAQSGCVHPMALFEKVGMFREDFFISMVDVEMQLKAKEIGYHIIQIAGCNLVHHIGSGRAVVFCGHETQVSDYKPHRHYYDSRNRILMWYEFPHDMCLKDKIHHLVGRLKLLVKIMLFEDEKFSKSIAIIRGTWNGLRNKAIPY